MQIIDADGHVNHNACMDEIGKFMPKTNQSTNQSGNIFPALDHLHFHYLRPMGSRTGFGNPGPREWVEFLDQTGIDWTVVYGPLSVGRLVSPEWAIAACKAYNNWFYEKFLNATPRIRGMALIPVQDVEGAVEELHRAVKELGMLGGMLPSNGEGLRDHLGSKIYWPIYEEAEKLGCSLAVHVGCLHHFGMDSFSTYYPVHALGHPYGLMVQALAMLCHGVFERFPGLRVAFLEGGATWVPFVMDRLDRSYHEGHAQVGLDGKPLVGPRPGEKASEHFRRHVKEGRIFVGFDCDDEGLGYSVKRAGREAFLYGSDFPHEVFDAKVCRGEIEELLGREDLTEKDKEAVLGGNARRFYAV